jgi:hypothetical protein
MGKMKKPPKKPVGTKWANRPVSVSPGNNGGKKPFDRSASGEGRTSSRPSSYSDRKDGKVPYKKPEIYEGRPTANNRSKFAGKGGKRPFKKPLPPGDEHALSTFVKKVADAAEKYLKDTYAEKASDKLEVIVNINTLQEKYGLVTARIHIMDDRYKDLLITAVCDKNRRHGTIVIASDPCEGFRPLYNANDGLDKFDKLFESYLPHILDSTWKKIQQLNLKHAKDKDKVTEACEETK